jgi:hypothetical protein
VVKIALELELESVDASLEGDLERPVSSKGVPFDGSGNVMCTE